MCTTELRDEIIAEMLVAHVKMPRRYAQWLVAQVTDEERGYLTRAAFKNRRAAVAAIQRKVHERKAKDPCFPENIPAIGPPRPAPDPPRRRRKSRALGGYPRLFAN